MSRPGAVKLRGYEQATTPPMRRAPERTSAARRGDQAASPGSTPAMDWHIGRVPLEAASLPHRASSGAGPDGPGQELPAALRSDMEGAFGHDFSSVRIKQGDAADAAAEHLGARAYTIGDQIVFGAGEYQPSQPSGRRLIAHELAHVVQQSRMGASQAGSPAMERAADHAASAVASKGSAAVEGAARPGIAMQKRSGLAALGDTEGLYPVEVTFKTLEELAAADTASVPEPWRGDDGLIHAIKYVSKPPPSIAVPKPMPPAAKRSPKPVKRPTPKPEKPVSAAELRDIAEALQPRLIYPKPVRQFFGGLQFVGGGLEAGLGGVGGIATAETGLGAAAGYLALANGLDNATSGWHTMWTGESSQTYSFRFGAGAARIAGADPKLAQAVGQSTALMTNIGSAGLSLSTMPSATIALTPEAELDLEFAQLANLEARPKFPVKFDPKWQDISEGVLGPDGYVLNPKLKDLDSLITPTGKIGGRNFGGKYMFVIDEQGVIRLGTRAQQHMPHPTLIGGHDPMVLAAGEIDIRAGQIHSINNLSGHFQPSPDSLGIMFESFSKLPDSAFRPGFTGLGVYHF